MDSPSPSPKENSSTQKGSSRDVSPENQLNGKAEEVEVLMKRHEEDLPAKRSWLPWKRAGRRDQQLAHLRESYLELIGLMRSIDGNLDRQNESREKVTAMVSQLPVALDSFRKLSNSQEEITSILSLINSHMENSHEKDRHLMDNLDSFRKVVGEVNKTNTNSLAALEKFQDRLEVSDTGFQTLFENSQKSSEALGGVLGRLEKRLFFSNIILAVVLVGMLLGGVWYIVKTQVPVPPTVPIAAEPAAPATVGGVEPAPAPSAVVQHNVVQPPVTEREDENVAEEVASATLPTATIAQELVPAVAPAEDEELSEEETETPQESESVQAKDEAPDESAPAGNEEGSTEEKEVVVDGEDSIWKVLDLSDLSYETDGE